MRALLPSLFLVACADGAEPEGESPEEHACERRAEEGVAVVPGATLDAGTAIVPGDEPYSVALEVTAPGFLAVVSEEDQAALLFLGDAYVLTGIWFDGEEQVLPAGEPNPVCPNDVPEHYDLDLEPGTWTLQVGPAAIAEVWMQLAAAEHEE